MAGWLGIGTGSLVYANIAYDDCRTDGHSHSSTYTLGQMIDCSGSSYWEWQCTASLPHWFIIDLGATYSITQARACSQRNNDPTSISVYISNNPASWGSAAVTFDPHDAGAPIAWINSSTFTAEVGRYVKVIITNTEAGINLKWGHGTANPPALQHFDVYGELAPQIESQADSFSMSESASETFRACPSQADSFSVNDHVRVSGTIQSTILDVVQHYMPITGALWFPQPSTGGGGIDFFEGYEESGGDESWDFTTSSPAPDKAYTTVVHPGHGNNVCRFAGTAGNNCYMQYGPTAAAMTHFSVRFYFYVLTWPGGVDRTIARVVNNTVSNTGIMAIYLEDGNKMRAYLATSSSSVSVTHAISHGWHMIEMYYEDDTEATIYLDGVNILTTSDPKYDGLDEFEIGSMYSSSYGADVLIDDVVIRDCTITDALIGDWSYASLVHRSSTDDSGVFTDEGGLPSSRNDAFFTFSSLPALFSSDSIKAVRFWTRGREYNGERDHTRPFLYLSSTVYEQRMRFPVSYQDMFCQWELNPDTDSAFSFAQINSLVAGLGLQYTSSERHGGQVSSIWLEVLHGSSGDAFLSHGPMFGGVTTSQIKVWVRVNEETDVKIRYGTNENYVKAGTGGDTTETDAATLDDSVGSTEFPAAFCGEFTISGLSQNTTYYFDVLVQQSAGHFTSTYCFERAGEHPNPYWASLPCCTTAISSTTDNFSFAVGGDMHEFPSDGHIFPSIAAKSPNMFINLGDEITNGTDVFGSSIFDGVTDTKSDADWAYQEVIDTYLLNRRNFSGAATHLMQQIVSRMCYTRVWSDHDHTGNNHNKIGDGVWGDTLRGLPSYASMEAFKACTASHDYAAPDDVVGTATAGSSTTVLCDSTRTADGDRFTGNTDPELDCYPGMVVRKTSGTLAWGEIKTVDSATQITLCTTMSAGESLAGGATYRIQRGGLWRKFDWGNAEVFVIDARYKRDPNKTPGSDKLDGTAYGRLKNNHYKHTHTTTAGTDPDNVYASAANFGAETEPTTTCAGDLVYNSTRSEYSLIDDIISTTQFTLQWPIYGQTTGDTIRIFESGSSDHGTDALNILAGHVQRTWLESSIRDSSAEWRVLICETPLMHDEHRNHDKWCDYDGNTVWIENIVSGWVQEGATDYYYYTVSDPGRGEIPGGVLRRMDGPLTGESVEYQALRRTDTKADLETANTGKFLWYWDNSNRRVYVYTSELLNNALHPITIYQPEYWNRCATRRYLMRKLNNLNAIWIGADRHIGALDDASHDDDPWPHVSAAPLGIDAGLTHLSGGSWLVDGKEAFYDSQWQAGIGELGSKTTPPGGPTEIGCFALMQVKNDEDRIQVTMFERDGYPVETTYDTPTGSTAKGELEMNIIFVSRLVDETFDDVTDYDYKDWTVVGD